jgi:hypothetical protein
MSREVRPSLCYCGGSSHPPSRVKRTHTHSNNMCWLVSTAAWETAEFYSNLRLYFLHSVFVVCPMHSWTEPNDRSVSEKAFSDISQLPKHRQLVSRRISVVWELCFQHHSSCTHLYISFPFSFLSIYLINYFEVILFVNSFFKYGKFWVLY